MRWKILGISEPAVSDNDIGSGSFGFEVRGTFAFRLGSFQSFVYASLSYSMGRLK